ncbi:MAG TPA: BamA/TamA family outer membrane protein [Thermoanaerobaculia bacterium]|nr:BamA/TamA family outer membrane protein [Thermoanaerobaculia bacterium]
MSSSRAARCALGALLLVAAPASAETFYGTGIASLSFRGDAPVDERRLAALTDLAPGRTLTGEAVRTSLRNLFATRLFSDLAVEASPSPAGSIVVVVFSAAPRIERLTISSGVPASGRILDAVGLGPGNPWQSDLKPRYEADIARILREEGYFGPKIATAVAAGADETSVDVRFDVEKGPRAVAGAPRFSAPLAPLDESTLLAKAKSKRGKPYRGSAAREDAERFAGIYRKAGYSRAEVRLDDEAYDAASATVTPHYALFVGPRVVLRVTGESEKVVRSHPDSPWTRGEPSDEDSLQLLKDGLRRTYQEKGYARAKVDVTFETTADEELVAFTIEKGERWTISTVEVTGAVSLRHKEVFGALQMRPRGFFELGRYVDGDALGDRDALEALYRVNGFRYARVSPPSATEGASRDTLDVRFKVEEGLRTFVATRTVKGIKTVPEDALLPRLAVRPGLPFSESSVSDDAALLQSLYVDRGYVDASVESSARFLDPVPPEGERAEVTYTVAEGQPVTFGKTILRGNRRTQPFIVEDRLANKEGSPFSLTKLLETQQNLARLGIFQKIEVSTFPTDAESMSRAVVVTVSEARPWSITYGIGAEYQPRSPGTDLSARLSLGVSYNNLFGRALAVSGEGRISNRDPRIILSARDRSLFGGRVPVSVAAYRTNDFFSDIEVKRTGAFLQMEYRPTTSLRTGLRYQYELVDPSSDPGLGADQRANQPSRISSIAGGVTWDRRDDPLNPRSGTFLAADVKYAFPLLAADADFVKSLLQAALYRPYGATRFVFSVRGGVIWNRQECPPELREKGTCSPNLIVPVPERLFAGGSSTHRAFPRDNLGIPDETLKDGVGVGGTVELIANAEWRIPVASGFEAALFFDIGNVWADPKNVTLRELRSGAGLGLHYQTPVGPIRLEYGLKLDRKSGEDAGAFAFSVGYPF